MGKRDQAPCNSTNPHVGRCLVSVCVFCKVVVRRGEPGCGRPRIWFEAGINRNVAEEGYNKLRDQGWRYGIVIILKDATNHTSLCSK